MSEDGAYRYVLNRRWNRALPVLGWIMLNPSKADEKTDDPTITRCCVRALQAGYGGICVLNLFALRATNPAQLQLHPDPVGPENDGWLAGLVSDTGHGAVPVIAAWGVHGSLFGRDKTVLKTLAGARLLCLGTTNGGQPRHPGRLGYDVPFVPFAGGLLPMTTGKPLLSENLTGEFIVNWFCEPPPLGGRFRCLHDEWTDGDPPQRSIYEIELIPGD